MDRQGEYAREQFRREVSDLLAGNLKRLRKARGLTQEELSFRADLNRIHVGLIERGARVPGIDTVFRLAGALEVEAGELLEGFDWAPDDEAGVGQTRGVRPEEKDDG